MITYPQLVDHNQTFSLFTETINILKYKVKKKSFCFEINQSTEQNNLYLKIA